MQYEAIQEQYRSMSNQSNGMRLAMGQGAFVIFA